MLAAPQAHFNERWNDALLTEGGLNEYQFAVFSKARLRSAATALIEAEPKYPETG
jgi:hypothetical protein